MNNNRKFLVLDAFRGVAALVVVEYHVSPLFGRRFFPHGYLAVDFFFMLSGFVLTHAYQRRLDQGWTLRKFLETRLVRLYPLYLAALLISAVLFALRVAVHSPLGHGAATYSALWVLAALFIPCPLAIAGYFPMIFPLNPPAWSLFYEMLINVAHARFGRRRPQSFLLWVAGAAALAMIAMTLHFGSLDTGEVPSQVGYALVRVTFAYATGSLLTRQWSSGRVRLPSLPLVSTALLLAVLAVPGGWHPALLDLLTVLIVFPALLLLGAAAEPAQWMVRPSVILGTSSYGIYVLHAPLIGFEEQLWTHLRGRSATLEAPWSGIGMVVAAVALVLALDRFYDLPVRAWMKRQLDSKAQSGARRVSVRALAEQLDHARNRLLGRVGYGLATQPKRTGIDEV